MTAILASNQIRATLCGGEKVDIEGLRASPMPESTKTFHPVNYADIALNVAKITHDLIPDYELKVEDYVLARKGNQFFGVQVYVAKDNSSTDVGMALGLRGSYDHSLSLGICGGMRVFVCDNMAFTGEISAFHKQTKNIMETLQTSLVTNIYKYKNGFIKLKEDAEVMKSIPLKDDPAFQFLGVLFGRGVLTTTQLKKARAYWKSPPNPEFEPRTAWSAYNAVNESLKTSKPNLIMKNHIDLHSIAQHHTKRNLWGVTDAEYTMTEENTVFHSEDDVTYTVE